MKPPPIHQAARQSTPLKTVPNFDFAPMDDAVAALKKSAAAFDAALTARGAQLSAKDRARLMALVGPLDQTLLLERACRNGPGKKPALRAWPLHRLRTKTMPGIREGIEDERL